MFNPRLSCVLFGLLVLASACKTSESASPSDVSASSRSSSVKTFDLRDASKGFDSQGITFFFSDIPVDQKINVNDLSKLKGNDIEEKMVSEIAQANGPSFYQLRQVYDKSSFAEGQVIGYMNRSDDTDTNIIIPIADDGVRKLKPNTTYKISAKLNFYTKVTSDSLGVGGSADSNAYGMIVSPYPFTLQSAADNSNGPKLNHGLPARCYLMDTKSTDFAQAIIYEISGDAMPILADRIGEFETEEQMIEKGVVIVSSLIRDILLENEVPSDELSKQLVKLIEQKVDEKLAALSPTDIESLVKKGTTCETQELKEHEASHPGSHKTSSSVHLRTFTKNEKNEELRVGVPAGDCTSTNQLSDVQKWICTHYSFMGRINNGKRVNEWTANSISTTKPVTIKTDAKGSPVYVNLTSHSGFEGLTVFYVSGIEITVAQ